MRIIALSDLHIDRQYSKEFAQKALDAAAAETADVLIIGGDTAETPEGIHTCLDLLSDFKGTKLAYLGNHELRAVEENLQPENLFYFFNSPGVLKLADIFSEHGFHLLETSPVIIDGVGFVGNIGWFDYTLYRGKNFERHLKQELSTYKTVYSSKEFNENLTRICLNKTLTHISDIEKKCNKIIVGIHHIATTEFLLYGFSDKFDQYNLKMGSEMFQQAYLNEKVKIGLCGHTHRSGKARINNTQVYNISSDTRRPYTVLDI